jgi:xanthine dehydrogenase accessory factor
VSWRQRPGNVASKMTSLQRGGKRQLAYATRGGNPLMRKTHWQPARKGSKSSSEGWMPYQDELIGRRSEGFLGKLGGLLDTIVALRAARQPFVLATVIEIDGSVSAKTGAKAVIGQDGRVIAGWVGGGCAESTVCQTALDCLRTHACTVIALDMNDEVLGTGMPCGGSMRVYVEPIFPQPMLWILGHGRVAETVCTLSSLMGFDVVVDDPLADRARYPDAARVLSDDLDYSQLTAGPADYVVVATQHKGDHESMQHVLRAGAHYVALIASRKRSRLVLEFLRHEGFGEGDLARIHAPAGLDFGARSPEEIALSVVSEMVMLRRGGSGARLDRSSHNSLAPPALRRDQSVAA